MCFIKSIIKLVILSTLVSLFACDGKKEDKQMIVSEDKIEHSIKAKEPTVSYGIDISHFQGEIDWVKIKTTNISFAYTKATQGSDYVDPTFQENWKNISEVGFHKGAYHFFLTKADPKAQAKHFMNTVGKVDKGDMPPALDLEQFSQQDDISVVEFQANVETWLNTVEESWGVKPIIYTNRTFANLYLNNSKFSNYLLWIADYGVEKPIIPAIWKENGWSIWQRTPKGSMAGEIGNVDHDIIQENIEGLVIQ